MRGWNNEGILRLLTLILHESVLQMYVSVERLNKTSSFILLSVAVFQ